ncbi:MAG: hypothetical protein WAM66_01305 [Acidobacteriaceae bacterium]
MSADQNPVSAPNHARRLWKTVLFVAGSIALSGVTLALWNRRELTEIQNRRGQPAPEEPSSPSDEEIY